MLDENKTRLGDNLGPLSYSLLMTMVLPFAVIFIIGAALALLLFWPIIPVACYIKRHAERQAQKLSQEQELELINE